MGSSDIQVHLISTQRKYSHRSCIDFIQVSPQLAWLGNIARQIPIGNKNINPLFSKRLSWNFEESLSRPVELGHHFIFSSEKARVSGRYSGPGRCEVLITEDLLLWLDNKNSMYRA